MNAERVLELIPVPPRVVGPGRRERDYRARIERLETDLGARTRELDTSQRLERGCQGLLDRMERLSDAERAKVAQLEQQQKRLILALGAAQREAELLRERLALTGGKHAQLAEASDAAPRKSGAKGWLRRKPRA